MNYAIRHLTNADLEPAKGYFETLSNLKLTVPPANASGWLESTEAQGTIILVAALDDGNIVGSISLLLERKFLRGGVFAGHIEDVATRAGYEGKGIGRALVAAAVKSAQDAGCYKVILDCDEKLIGFYEKCGFTTFGVAMRKDF